MSLHDAAQHLAAQGRGPDNTLVHMSNDEVAGLQAIAMMKGGSLTVNPETGMAEAGFLDDIMPTLVGAAGMYFGIDPMTTAAIMGGGTALQTGDLSKGLMAGLGAYGGANLAGGVMEAGSGALAESAGLGAGEALQASNAERLGAGLKAVTGEGGLSTLQAGMPIGGTSALKAAGMAAAPAIMGMMQPQAGSSAPGTPQMIRPYTFSANAQKPENMVSASYQPGQDTSERQWFQPSYTALQPYRAAQGGLADLTRIVTGEDVMPSERREEGMAAGGLSTLGSYAAGGNPRLLKGPGDGMSDNIPAVIGAKQPARLADGEFVVPADVVSHLGNGSTDAGAKQLYKMMDRIRQKRTGKKKQAPQVNPARAMPA